jgi:uncharacterized protein (TIGR02271 family)
LAAIYASGKKLDVSKTQSTSEARIKKEQVLEEKTVQVPVTHEKVTIERRPASGAGTSDRPVNTETDVTIPLKHEEVQVTKKPYVKEEVVVKEKPVTETKTVQDEVRSETVQAEGEVK